jgi:hypothetical protein
MFRKNQSMDLSIMFGGILASLFMIYFGSSINVSASVSATPDYLIGNLSLNNVTTSQVLEISEKIANATKHFVQESKGNLTRMNILIIDELENRNIINEKDKQELLSLNDALSTIKPTNNLTLIDRDVSSLEEEMTSNSSNPVIVTLKGDLKRKIHDIGTDVGTLIAGNVTGNLTGNVTGNLTGNVTGNLTGNVTGNLTGNVTGNLTDGITGLPPMTIGDFWDDEHRSLRLTLGCQALGSAVSGFALGSYMGSICGVILV